jgi:hypothetical protein
VIGDILTQMESTRRRGTATVFQYWTSQASVLVRVGEEALHTEQALTDVGTTVAERAGAEGAPRSVQVALPNDQAALAYQRGVLGTATGEYNLATNSAERAQLHESLRRSIAQAKAGQLINGDDVIAKLLARP